jgi:magnesium-transporting ATPase (P-type)
MERPPRHLREHVISPALLRRAYLWLGPIQALATMAAFYFMYWTNGYAGQWLGLPSEGALYHAATGMALAAVVTTQIGNLFTQRSERVSIFRIGFGGNRLLWLCVATELAVILAVIYVPFVGRIIGTAPFPLQNWLFLFAWVPSLILVDEIRKAMLRSVARVRAHVAFRGGVAPTPDATHGTKGGTER